VKSIFINIIIFMLLILKQLDVDAAAVLSPVIICKVCVCV